VDSFRNGEKFQNRISSGSSPITNLDLRLKGTVLIGDHFSEYGKKPNDARLELRIRYYF